MTLLADLIVAAADPDQTPSSLLRRLLVLSYDLDNDDLKNWVDHELEGYPPGEDLPGYRVCSGTAKGHFSGPLGATIRNQPLPPMVLDEQVRHYAETAYLRQPVAAYEGVAKEGENPRIEWPANLTAIYQSSFIDGYALSSAWLSIPRSFLVAIPDIVRTKTLRFSLEMRRQSGGVLDPSQVPPEKVQQTVTTIIYGGNNVIAGNASAFQQIGQVGKNDFQALSTELRKLGASDDQVSDLEKALEKDKAEVSGEKVGPRTSSWLSKVGSAIGTAGATAGVEVAKSLVLQYLGLS